MSFSQAGSKITQTGTDANLSGLNGVAGVTTTSYGNTTIYDIGNQQLEIQGTLSHDPDAEVLIIGNTAPRNDFFITSTGTYNYGRTADIGQINTTQTRGCGLFITQEIDGTENQFTQAHAGFVNQGTFNWIGGTILCNSSFWGDASSSTLLYVRNGTLVTQSSSGTPRIDMGNGATVDIIGLEYRNTQGNGLRGFILRKDATYTNLAGLYVEDSSIAFLGNGNNQPSSSVLTLTDIARQEQLNDDIWGLYQKSQFKFINYELGASLADTTLVNRWGDVGGMGCALGVKQVSWNFKDGNGANIQGVKMSAIDTDSGSRPTTAERQYYTGITLPVLENDIEYTGTSDVSGNIAQLEVAHCFVIGLDSTYPTSGGTANVWKADNRTNNQSLTAGTITFYYAVYGKLLNSKAISMNGTGAYLDEVTMVTDVAVTEQNGATVGAYTELENPQKWYDYDLYHIVQNYNRETSTRVSRSGNVIDAGSYDVTIDATAVSVYAFDGSTITIKASTFTGNINTTGTVTLANGAVLNGVINGRVDVTNGATYTEDIDGKFVVDTDTVTSFTISGFIPTEIEHVGSGTTTILGINNAKLTTTTITATGGTLTLGDGLNPSSNYTINGNNIELTGTETDLLGLRGLAEVDYTLSAGKYTFTLLGQARLVVKNLGSLIIDPDFEAIVCGITAGSGQNNILLESGSSLQIGRQTINSGFTSYSEGDAIVFTTDSSNSNFLYQNSWANLRMLSGSTLEYYGGNIVSSGCIAWESGSTINTYSQNAKLLFVDGLATQLPQLRQQTSLATINGLTLEVGKYTAIANPIAFNGYNPINADRAIDISSSTPSNEFLTFYDLLASQGTNADVGMKDNKWVRLINTNIGSDVNVIYQSTGTEGGLVETRKEVVINVKDDVGANLAGVTIYGTDTDHGNRVSANTYNSNPDYVADRVYTGTSDGSGLVSFTGDTGSILASVLYLTVGAVNLDSRGLTNDRADNFLLRAFAYGRQITDININLKGTGQLSVNSFALADGLITESNQITVDAYTTLDNTREVYDRAISVFEGVYAGEASTPLSREGSILIATGLTVTVNGDGATVYDLTGSALTIKSSNFTGGFRNTTVSHGTGSPLFTNLVLENSTWNADQATWTGSADATSTVDVGQAGTYDATGFDFDASSTLNNSSGGAITVVLSSGQQQPIVTGATVNFQVAGATITFNNLASANVQIMEDDNITVNARVINQTGTYVYNAPNGASGTWCYIINRAGYEPIIGTFDPVGNDVTVNGSLDQKLMADGSAMYAGTTSAFLSVTTSSDGSRMNLRIGDGAVSGQAGFDEVEDALSTQDGMSYLCNGGGQVALGIRPNGTFFDMGTNVRLIRDQAGDVNAEFRAIASSTDGIVIDGANGSVIVTQATNDVNVISVNGTPTTSIHDFKNPSIQLG